MLEHPPYRHYVVVEASILWAAEKDFVPVLFLSCFQNPRLVAAFYSCSLEGSPKRDSINFDFLGHQKKAVQTNYFVDGVGRHEIVHLLGYDTSANPHNYSIYWDNSKIVWYVDGNIIRQVTNDNVNPFPSKSQYVYQSVWDASYVCGGAWAGVNTWANAPHYARWTNIAVHCPGQ